MKLVAWRIFKPKHFSTAFTGEGARLYGGRWNSKGTSLVYTAGSQSLAALEMLVHLSSSEVLASYQVCSATFEDSLVETLDVATLPADWRSDPAPIALRAIGDEWIRRARSAILQVPSVIVPQEFNYLLNPVHTTFSSIQIGLSAPFEFDPRLIKS